MRSTSADHRRAGLVRAAAEACVREMTPSCHGGVDPVRHRRADSAPHRVADLVRSARANLTRLAPLAVLLAMTVTLAGDGIRLIDAVRGGDRAAVRSLLHAKADVNAAEADGTTALQWAA